MAALFFLIFCATSPAGAITFPLAAKWSATLPFAPAFAPAFDAEQIYVSLRNNQLVALLIKDGTTRWSVECPMTAAPAAGDGLVFAGSEDLIEARAQADGRAQWRRPVKGRIIALHWDTGWLIAATENGPLVALRATDGEILWQRDLGSTLSGAPALAGDRVYLPLKDGRLIAASLQTGEDIWGTKFAESAAGILAVGDRVFVGGRDNQFHSLDAKDGDADWRWKTGADVLGLPVLDERRVYFIALDNVLRGHDRNSGSMLWKRVLPMRPFTGPILTGSLLIASGVAAELHAYNAGDGTDAGKFIATGTENEEMLLAAPPHLTSQDLIVIVTRGGQVRALGPGPAASETPPAAAPATPPPDAAADAPEGAAGATPVP